MPETQRLIENIGARTEYANAFLKVLIDNSDAPITAKDLYELYPELNWEGKLSVAWDELYNEEHLEPHLIRLLSGKSAVYAYMEKPNDPKLLYERMLYIENESSSISTKEQNKWTKRVGVLKPLATAAVASMAVIAYRQKYMKKKNTNKHK